MVRIVVTPMWAKLIDFEVTLPTPSRSSFADVRNARSRNRTLSPVRNGVVLLRYEIQKWSGTLGAMIRASLQPWALDEQVVEDVVVHVLLCSGPGVGSNAFAGHLDLPAQAGKR